MIRVGEMLGSLFMALGVIFVGGATEFEHEIISYWIFTIIGLTLFLFGIVICLYGAWRWKE